MQGDPLDQEFSGVKQKVASSIQQKLAIPVLDNRLLCNIS